MLRSLHSLLLVLKKLIMFNSKRNTPYTKSMTIEDSEFLPKGFPCLLFYFLRNQYLALKPALKNFGFLFLIFPPPSRTSILHVTNMLIFNFPPEKRININQ